MRAGLNQESLPFQSIENFVSKNQETLSNEMSKVFLFRFEALKLWNHCFFCFQI